jgi:transposase
MSKSHLSKEVKIMAIEYYQNHDVSFDKVSEIFKVNEKTIRRWIDRYKKEDLERKNKKQVSYKVKEKHVKYALVELKKSPTLTIEKLYSKVKTKYDDFNISVGYLSEVIRDNNFTRKRTRRVKRTSRSDKNTSLS